MVAHKIEVFESFMTGWFADCTCGWSKKVLTKAGAEALAAGHTKHLPDGWMAEEI